MDDEIERCIHEYLSNKHHLSAFASSIQGFFVHHPELSNGSSPVIHSIRSRMKDEAHLREKLVRKRAAGRLIEPSTMLTQITDLAGIRLLHLYQTEFAKIHHVIRSQLDRGDWCLHEEPVAYTWDPECTGFFEGLGLTTKVKESFYTSIHYVLKPRSDSTLCCELQVRTLFEEAWGEIDHGINYPHPTNVETCREQLRVLSKLVGAATRLADSIYRARST